MLDYYREQARLGITNLIRLLESDDDTIFMRTYGRPPTDVRLEAIADDMAEGDPVPIPDLTVEQKFGLDVLLATPGQLANALADYLIDQGHEYALAVAEKARQEERERIGMILDEAIQKHKYNMGMRQVRFQIMGEASQVLFDSGQTTHGSTGYERRLIDEHHIERTDWESTHDLAGNETRTSRVATIDVTATVSAATSGTTEGE